MSDEDDYQMLKMDGFDDFVIGTCERFGQEEIIAYDKRKVLAKLVSEDMTEEEALEHFYFNQVGAWVGEGTPCFIDTEAEPINQAD